MNCPLHDRGRFAWEICSGCPSILGQFEYAKVSIPVVILIFVIAYFACKWLKLPRDVATHGGAIDASNFLSWRLPL
jgi:hypothetical protein